MHGKLIYNNFTNYSASLLRKVTKLYKQTAIVVENELVDIVKEKALNPDIAEIDEIFKR